MKKVTLETVGLMVVGLSIVSSNVSIAKDKVIYGEDNRRDLLESPLKPFQKLALSTAVQIERKNFKTLDNGDILLNGSETLQNGMQVCESEPFAKQLSVGNCSGFLVSSNLLVTAGHCITSTSDCEDFVWAFDYAQGKMKNNTLLKSNVYTCVKVIKQALNPMTMDDYAVIQLDRPVLDRAPLNFRLSGQVKTGDSLVVIGHPSGLPTKIAGGASVKSVEDAAFFEADLDTYGGNSGSGVFNGSTGEIEGILVRGAKDYVYDAAKKCLVSNRCDKMDPSSRTCGGESVSRISAVDIIGFEMADLKKSEPSLQDTSPTSDLLLAAVKHRKYPLVRYLLEKDASGLDKKDSQQDTALHLAIKNNDYYSTKLLLEKGADFSLKGKENLKAKKLSKKLKRDKRFKKLLAKHDKWYLPGKR